jgi:hypothetical protein
MRSVVERDDADEISNASRNKLSDNYIIKDAAPPVPGPACA